MNFRSWPDEFRSTKLRGLKREVLIFIFFLFSPSLTLYAQNSGKWEILPQMRFFVFSFYTLVTWHTLRHVSPPCLGSFLRRNNLFLPESSSNYLIRTLFKLLPNFQDFRQKSRFWGPSDTHHLEKCENSDRLRIQRNFFG